MRTVPLRLDGSLLLLGRDPRETAGDPGSAPEPDWIQADPRRIRAALARASDKPSGGWVVLDATRVIRERPRKYILGGRELVAWWDGNGPKVAPDACPHMGASLSCGSVDGKGRLVCPWHGLPLGEGRHGGWAPLRAYDDGVLTWARLSSMLAPGETATDAPILPVRPARFLDAVVRTEARCEPQDVIANRLDPWHGAHFHPHSFARLRVIGEDDESITVRVVYRIVGRFGMEVDARFACPDPRTIAMTIVAGEGVGSVVETHATPIAPDRTAVIEATLAASERPALAWLPRASAALRGLVQSRAARLWVDDAQYCARTYELRTKKPSLPVLDDPELPAIDAE
ncbi:MAG: DUF5914 domain-containing protein [Myxococcota bacterium]|nr:DUF5914 domain-containing protein [Myxococcota bacterium]